VAVHDAGPHRKRVEFTRPLGRGSRVRVTYTLDARATALRVRFRVDWHEPQALLKAHFPTRYAGSRARFGAPFGSVLRPAQPGMPHEEAQWESAGSRWACVFDEGETNGLYLVTRDSYGFACYDGDLNVSLVRSPAPPEADRKRLGAVLVGNQTAYGEDHQEELLTDLGEHTIDIAVGLYDSGAPRAELPPMLADTLYTPPVAYHGRPVESLVDGFEGADSVVPCWVEPGDEGAVIVRLHETLGRHAVLHVEGDAGGMTRVDLRGRPAGTVEEERIEFGPYEVTGVRLC
jgi:alpha-mannosidase